MKKVQYRAAQIVSGGVRDNINGLSVSPELKEVLLAAVAANETDEKNQFSIAIMSQHAAAKKLGGKASGKRFPNPYWFEFGTVPRTSSGGNRGQIQPTPFFRPAVQAKRNEVREALISGFEDIIKQAAK